MTSAPNAAQPSTAGVTIVTQTRVAPDKAEAFASWQRDVSGIVAAQPGFIEQTILPPSPPSQLDWVILQRFARTEDAIAWLRSDERARLVAQAQPMLVGQDDVHLLNEDADWSTPRSRFRRDLDAHQAGARKCLPRVGAPDRCRPGARTRISGIQVRAAGSGRSGRLVGDPAVRLQKRTCRHGSPHRSARSFWRKPAPSPKSITRGSFIRASTSGFGSAIPRYHRRRPGSRT